MKSICVFCGANKGNKPVFIETAQQLGAYLAQNQIKLVYGGGSVGLMGIIADNVLANGGEVVGVIPSFMKKWEVAHKGVEQMIFVETMHERKALMDKMSEAAIALPGGFGTLDELFEMLTWSQLQLHSKPIGLLNVGDYFTPLLQMIDKMVEDGFLKVENKSLLIVGESIGELFEKVNSFTAEISTKWIDRA